MRDPSRHLLIPPAAIARDRLLLLRVLAIVEGTGYAAAASPAIVRKLEALAGTRWEAEIGAAVAKRLEELEGEIRCNTAQ